MDNEPIKLSYARPRRKRPADIVWPACVGAAVGCWIGVILWFVLAGVGSALESDTLPVLGALCLPVLTVAGAIVGAVPAVRESRREV